MPGPDDVRTLDLSIERLAFGGDAVARHDGRVVFVPLAAPGDRVRAAVVERRRDWLRAELRELVSSGPDRVAPPCPEFGTCGGCQWQHVSTDAQRSAKADIVREQLARLAGIRDVDVRPVRAAPDPWAYRDRITLVADGRLLGFHRARSHRLVEIGHCAIADPVLSRHLETARAWVATLRGAPTRVTLARAADGVALVAALPGRPVPPDVDATEHLLAADASVRGAVLVGAGVRVVVGDPAVRVPVEPDLVLEVPADAFTQVHAAANLLLVDAVLAASQVGPGDRALDLYCGAGNFALPLARRGAMVTGIERSEVAVSAARANAARLGLAATFQCGAVEQLLERQPAEPLDLVVLDPPRAGAPGTAAALARRRPPRVVYVSCDPATLARDARALAAAGYRLDHVQPVDLFPQTYHVETVAQFVLT